MRSRHLFYPVLLLLFASCQKNLTTGAANPSLPPASKKSLALPVAFTADEYKISSVTIQQGDSNVGQNNYTYNTDGTLQRISEISTSGGTTVTTTMNFTYSGNTVQVDRLTKNSNAPAFTIHYGYTFIKDSLGRWVQFIQQNYVLVGGAPAAKITHQLSYDNNNEVVTDKSIYTFQDTTVTGTNYSWINGNLNIVSPANPVNASDNYYDKYTYYTNQPCQPGDIRALTSQWGVGFPILVSANLTQSDVTYKGGTNIAESGNQYTYEFDSKGRVSKGVYSTTFTSLQDYRVNATYLIHYVNN
jgi:hypothetical protein